MYGGRPEWLSSKSVCEEDFKKFLDSEGRLIDPNGLRQAIYEGGVEPTCRKIVWCYLLNIFPISMTRMECAEYLKDVSQKYERYIK